jgi:cytochrome c oxidase assembly protein subunit 16
MPTFQSNPFRPSTSSSAASLGERIGTTYRRRLANHPFLLFGLPFISVIVASSFLLTPATALRYERHDRKNRAVTHGEAMELGLKGLGDEEVNYNPRRRKVTKGGTTERDEYYVSFIPDGGRVLGVRLLTGL